MRTTLKMLPRWWGRFHMGGIINPGDVISLWARISINKSPVTVPWTQPRSSGRSQFGESALMAALRSPCLSLLPQVALGYRSRSAVGALGIA
jgi:hypothetical protein